MTTEKRVFATALAVGLAHAVDDALLHRQPGVPVTRHLVALLAVTVAAVLAVLVLDRLRPGLRAGLALAGGGIVLANGALHLLHVAGGEADHSDLSGVLAAVAGLVLLGLGVVIPARHRHEVPGTATRRWVRRVSAVVLGAVAAQLVLAPVLVGHRADAPVPCGRRRPAGAGVPAGRLPVHRRAAAVRVVPPVDERRRGRGGEQRQW